MVLFLVTALTRVIILTKTTDSIKQIRAKMITKKYKVDTMIMSHRR